jgi:predicted transcriptional regulator of viral defense system
MQLDDLVLRELHRAAVDAGRRGITFPSTDLDAVAKRAGSSEPAAQKALQRLVRAGRVARVRKDLLILPETTGHLGVDLVDLVDAVAGKPYLITAGRALEHHDLTDQHFFGVVVLAARRVEPLAYRGQTAKFLHTDPGHIWGAEEGPGPNYANPARAIVDALNHPRYGVSLTQALDALLLAVSRDAMFTDRLLNTVIRYDSPAVARRVGLVVERFIGAEAAAPYRDLIGQNRAPVLMRARRSPDGKLDTAWRVVVNTVLEPERVRV